MDDIRFPIGSRVRIQETDSVGVVVDLYTNSQGPDIYHPRIKFDDGPSIKYDRSFVEFETQALAPRPTPQPHLFDRYEEAAKGTAVNLGKNGPVYVKANFASASNYLNRAVPLGDAAPVVYMGTRIGSVGMTLEQAKQVAVALFDQILYFENLKTREAELENQ